MTDSAVRKRILLLDESANDRLLALRILTAEFPSHEVVPVATSQEFSRNLENGDFDLVIAERSLSWIRGERLLQTVSSRHPDCPLIFFTRPNSSRSVVEDLEAGAYATLIKNSEGYLLLPYTAKRALNGQAPAREGEASALDRLPVGLIGLHADGRISHANDAAQDILGVAVTEQLEGNALLDFLDSKQARMRVQAMLENGGTQVDIETRLRRTDGENIWVRLRLWRSPVQNKEFEGVLENISDYKQTEAELARQAADLGRSNTELEQFAYVVTHDLQEPLSLIQRYSAMLAEHKEIADHGAVSRYVDQVLSSSRRMQAMMDGILEFSRIETKGTPFSPVDFNAVVGEACDNLAAMVESADARIQYANLPTIKADHGQMLQLFQNLIANAIKFCASGRRPEIMIQARETGDCYAFTVRDNGIGIPRDSRDRIFGMFQRLHTGDEFPGTGIGLAICKSIVKRHDGDIHVDSAAGGGSEVHFTIGKWL